MSELPLHHFSTLALYNEKANRILYDACARLEDSARKQARPAFFSSIHGALNHILVGDRIWMARFEGETAPSTRLDAILHEAFDDLRAAREAMDLRITAFMERLAPEFLAGSIHYVNNEGKTFDDPVAMLLIHFFNHQTHHRGQVHGLLSQTDVPPPSLDLHRVLKPEP